MRLAAWTWPFPFLVRVGALSTTVRNPRSSSAPGRVYVLRGQGVVFSGGFGPLCDDLRRMGLWAEDLRCVGDLWVRRHLRKDQRAGKLRGPVVLVGHSCGGRYALHTARQLARLGIVIDLLICVDVALPPDVSDNVRHAVHLYRSRWRAYPARPLRAAPGSRAVIENVDLDSPESPIRAGWLNHLAFTQHPDVRAWIVERIGRVAG